MHLAGDDIRFPMACLSTEIGDYETGVNPELDFGGHLIPFIIFFMGKSESNSKMPDHDTFPRALSCRKLPRTIKIPFGP